MNRNTKKKIKLYFTLALLTFLVVGLIYLGATTILDPGRINVFNKSGFPKIAVQIWGVYTILGSLLMAHPRTFVIGCAMLLLNNFFTIGNYIKAGNVGGAALEALSMAIPIFFLWAGHPYTQWKDKNGTAGQPSAGKAVKQ